MNISFQYNKEIDLRKLLYTLVDIHRGFFRDNGFFLTSEINTSYSNFVVLPKWEILKSTSIWEKIAHLSNKMKSDPLYYLKTPLDEFKELESEFEKLIDLEIADYQNEWLKIEKEVSSYCKTNLNLKNTELEIYLTRFGTKCSYALEADKVIAMPINSIKYLNSNIVFCLLSSSVHEYADDQKHNVSWKEKQIAIDSVIKSTNLSKLIGEYSNVIDDIKTSKVNHKIIQSDKYMYDFLGIDHATTIEFINQKVLINNKEIEFTKGEEAVFKLIYFNKSEVTTYEQISESIWNTNVYNKFSLEAINKKIERIRKKIKGAGIYTPLIQTKSGIGYYWSLD